MNSTLSTAIALILWALTLPAQESSNAEATDRAQSLPSHSATSQWQGSISHPNHRSRPQQLRADSGEQTTTKDSHQPPNQTSVSSERAPVPLGLQGTGAPAPPPSRYVFGKATYEVGQLPSAVTVGDFNGDGIPDVASSSSEDQAISILLSTPSGTMQPPATIQLHSAVYGIARADFNGDGKLDLVVAETWDSRVAVLLGNGDGTFQAPILSGTGMDPVNLKVWDLSGDGKPDLVVMGFFGLYTLLGNGDGTFQAPVQYPAFWVCDSVFTSIGVGDFNGDGKTDLAIPDMNYVGLMLGNGDGTFQPAQPFGSGTNVCGVAAGDFNGDRKLDLAVARQDNKVSIFTGIGDGTFSAANDFPVGPWPTQIEVADLNGDGKLDIVTADSNYGYSPSGFGAISVLIGKGDGTFQASKTYGTGVAPALALADFNGDSVLDIAATSQNCVQSLPCGVGQLSVLLGRGDGTFLGSAYTTPAHPSSIAAADFNGDGKLDLAIGNKNDQDFKTASILLNNGDDTFGAPVNYEAGGGTLAITAGDFNRDRKQDLAVANFNEGTVAVLLGNGDGSLQARREYPTGASPVAIITGDFNRDGIPDLATVTSLGSSVSILLGNGDGSFRSHTDFPASTSTMDVKAGDFNGDGKLDLVVTNFNVIGTISVLMGNGDGTFRSPVSYEAGPSPKYATVGDFNGDGKLDLAVGQFSSANFSTVAVFLGNGDGSFRPLVNYDAGHFAGSIFSADLNGDGNLDLAVSIGAGYTAVAVLYGLGDGTFIRGADYLQTSGSDAVTIAAADLSGTGTTDLLATSYSGNRATVLLNSPEVAISPNRFTFYRQAIGDVASPTNFLLSNPSAAPLLISSLGISSDFTQTNTCSAVLGVGESCEFTAKFAPLEAGIRMGAITIQDNAPTGIQAFQLAGLGYAVKLSSTAASFGVITPGKTDTRQITLSNRSSADIAMNAITLSGPDRAEFSQANTCGSKLPAHGNCSVTITFKPVTPGIKVAGVSVYDSDAVSPQSIVLRGISRR